MKDSSKDRRRRYPSGGKFNKRKRKKKSGRGHQESSGSESDIEWQPWMSLQDSGRKKGDVSLCVCFYHGS